MDGPALGVHRQDVKVAARPHEEGELCQALDLSPRCPGLLNPDPTTTSESESEGTEAAPTEEHIGPLVRVALISSSALFILSNHVITPTSEPESKLRSESGGGEAAVLEEQAGGGHK